VSVVLTRNPIADEVCASRLGRVPLIACLASIGVLVCSVADALSRATLAPSSVIFWGGLLLIVLPIFYRLSSAEASSSERFALVCLLGLTLYAVKLARDPFAYTFADELVHAYNANQIASHHKLFNGNPILPVTALYPGLEGTTSALMSMTGLSSFGAGLIVIAAARLVMVSALFLLFGRISGSSRVAGLGVAFYVGNSNFLFWSDQFSYESLALPLLVVVLVAVAERDTPERSEARAWAVPIVLGTAAVVVTHHLTSYALTTVLVALALIHLVVRRSARTSNPWPFAALALALSAFWLIVVASITVGYLSPVLSAAFKATLHTVSGEAAPRHLFQSPGSGLATPVGERIVALIAVAILAAGLPFGLRRAWREYRTQPLVSLFCVAAIAYFGTLALRFAPQAWETGNRASEFLFIGLAFILACSRLERYSPRRARRLGRVLLAGCLGIVAMGGVISGWPAPSRLSRPLVVTAEGNRIESEPLGFARWVSRQLPGRRFAASDADARLLLDQGRATAFTGHAGDIEDILQTPTLPPWQLLDLRELDVRYVVTDSRRRSFDTTTGYYFSVTPPAGTPDTLLPAAVADKFERVRAPRIFDSGSIVVYGLDGRP
jgi:hypothetical protein